MDLSTVLRTAGILPSVPGIQDFNPGMPPRNPLQTALNVAPPSVGNAQPSYDFQGQGMDQNNPYVPEIQTLLKQIQKKNEELTKAALAASAHQKNVPTQNPNPIRPGANLLGAGIGILGELLGAKGGGLRGYQAFTQGAQNTEATRFQNALNAFNAQNAAAKGEMDAKRIELEGLKDQIGVTSDLSKQYDDQINKSVMNEYRMAQQEGLNERAAAQNALRALDIQVKEMKLELEQRAFNEIKTPESQVKIAKTLQDIENAKERAKTEITKRAKMDAEINGIKARAKLTGSQNALVDKKVASYDDEYKARIANVYSQISKRAVDGRKAEGKTGDTITLNQRRVLLESIIRIGGAQLKKLSALTDPIRWAEVKNDIENAQEELRAMGRNNLGGATMKRPPRAMPGTLQTGPKSGGVKLPPGAKRVG